VKDTSSEFLKYLDKQEIALGSEIEIIEKESFDSSLEYAGIKEITVSNKIASNLYINYVSICSRLFHKH
jgi:DtxR family Mn-dependent transcriptional regulator